MATYDSTPEYIAILLPHGHITFISPEDEDLALRDWRSIEKGGRRYVCMMDSGNLIYLHRVILCRMLNVELERKQYVDHQDTNSLNNQRKNLRLATNQQNQANSQLSSDNTSGYKGVFRNEKSWAAHITFDHKHIHLGTFNTIEEAAIAYNHAAKQYFGDFALFNNIEGWELVNPIPRSVTGFLRSENTSGYKYIQWVKFRWRCYLVVNDKKIHLGYFSTVDEARSAQINAAMQYGIDAP